MKKSNKIISLIKQSLFKAYYSALKNTYQLKLNFNLIYGGLAMNVPLSVFSNLGDSS